MGDETYQVGPESPGTCVCVCVLVEEGITNDAVLWSLDPRYQSNSMALSILLTAEFLWGGKGGQLSVLGVGR